MRTDRQPTRPNRDERGFILVIVLWVAGLLAVMTASLSLSVRTQVRVAANLAESAKAEALANAGITLAVMDLVAAQRSRDHERRFPVEDSAATTCSIPGDGTLRISVKDEASRIDMNSAGLPIIQALLVGLGETPEKAAQVADAIFDYRDDDDTPRANGAESAAYRTGGLGWLPKNGPMQSVDELGQVYGITPGILARIRPFVGVHSGLAGIDASMASEKLIAVLRTGLQGISGTFGSFPEFHESVALPAMFVTASRQRVYDLRIEARTSEAAIFVREAVVDLGSRQAPHHVFLRWTRGLAATNLDRFVSHNGLKSVC